MDPSTMMMNEMFKTITEGFEHGDHIVKDHMMVGDLTGLIRGTIDWTMN